MSPTVFYDGGYRYFFFSREEPRIHVHVRSSEGEAKFWLEPVVEVARKHNLNNSEINKIQKTVESRKDELIQAWQKHFGS